MANIAEVVWWGARNAAMGIANATVAIVKRLGRALEWLDDTVVTGLFNALGGIVMLLAMGVRQLHSGRAGNVLLTMLVTLLLVFLFFR